MLPEDWPRYFLLISAAWINSPRGRGSEVIVGGTSESGVRKAAPNRAKNTSGCDGNDVTDPTLSIAFLSVYRDVKFNHQIHLRHTFKHIQNMNILTCNHMNVHKSDTQCHSKNCGHHAEVTQEKAS